MNKLLSLCLLANGVTGFAPVGKPFAGTINQQQQQRGKWYVILFVERDTVDSLKTWSEVNGVTR